VMVMASRSNHRDTWKQKDVRTGTMARHPLGQSRAPQGWHRRTSELYYSVKCTYSSPWESDRRTSLHSSSA
jgi:hypothetical protein